jgi:hypothetical protein
VGSNAIFDSIRTATILAKMIFSVGKTGVAERASPEEIKDAAKRIRDSKAFAPLPPVDEILRVATPMFQGPTTPAKWEAVLELVNLRSFVNTTLDEAKRHVVGTVVAQEVGVRTGSRTDRAHAAAACC